MSESPVLSFANLSLPVRVALGMIGGGGGAALTHSMFGMTGVYFFLAAVIAVGLLLLVYTLILRQVRNRRAASFAESVQSQSSSSPSSLSKAEQIAKLDDLRRKFEEGVETFRRAGKDFYSLPWYLLIGESGSGKTEAMRRSGVGFPSGVQDYLQGVGGTINMHWWFTNQAVVLDLAGRVVFGEVASGASSEWETFLRLLKKHRPNCPINGMLLVIPAKSLLRDTPEEMVRKAQKISDQINRVQRVLDVRFPVFIMVTMCDLVTGFREFFEPLRGGEEQQQMLGWSNPQPIDAAFRTEMTEQYLATVVERLLRRRQLMLRDPTPQRDLSDSRLDEVDALFKLPDGFSQLAGTLKLYLQTIFVPTEWAAKPPFLRGIYFTSSMQEGAALDAELAKALGLPLDKLPEDGIWKRERALFLRDLFIDKVFQEKGLVTRASNVQRQYRRRKLALLGAGASAAALLLFLTWFGWRDLEKRVGREGDQWKYVADEYVEKRPLSVVAPSARVPGAFEYRGGLPVLMPEGRPLVLSELQERLFTAVRSPLNVPRIFRLTRPSTAGFDSDRRAAFRVVFEKDVLKPVIDCASVRLQNDNEVWSPAATEALAALIRLRANVCEPKERLPQPADIDSLFRYVLSDSDYARCAEKDLKLFEAALVWCYDPKSGGRQPWPPAWLPQDLALGTNSAVAKGVARFIDHAVRSAGDVEPEIQEIVKLKEEMRKSLEAHERSCNDAETALFSALEKNQEQLVSLRKFALAESVWNDQLEGFSNAVVKASEALAGFRQRCAKIPLCSSDNMVSNYYARLADASNTASTVFASLKLPGVAAPATNVTLVADIQKRMASAVKGIVVRPDAGKIIGLRDFESMNRCFAERVHAFEERARRYSFPAVPALLRPFKGGWKDQRAYLYKLNVRDAHKALAQFCGESIELCAACRLSSNSVAIAETLDLLSSSAQKGLSSSKEGELRQTAKELLERWSQLDESAVEARKTILAFEPYGFEHDYFAHLSEQQHDYVIQFWQGLAEDALGALANEVEPAIQKQWDELHKLARFPLDVDSSRGKPLTLQELAQARQALDQAEKDFGLQGSGQGKTIGEGAQCRSKYIKEQLNRLCNPQSASKFAWIRAARRIAFLLPDGVKEFTEFSLSLVPDAEQGRLTGECGKSNDVSACVVFENHYVSAKGNEDRSARCRMGTGESLGRMVFPRESFTLSLYEYRDAPELLSIGCPGEAPWAVLNVLLDPWSRRAPDNPRKWFVPLRIKKGDKDVLLWLQIETGNKEIPTRSEWPQEPPPVTIGK